ncbi:glycosyltransferase family A protein [Niallia sp. Man26]|uniref:glycosyltransferase family 2 protein n=1 Tax=Niallia sp. Man26 TaxID=2912824 RepID=UPI001EDA6B9F|nr:glycosyltransferase family A protein [Niallia sp. Man26]UPO87341.1 glycosyltransferase family 2 protein [Niallia sp. Man26]
MNNPLISVIVPIYNVEAYVARCINSIKNQSYQNIQILAINDGSTDNSLSILENIGNDDSRIEIINKENGGQASARNLGISIAKGKYFMFVDSDDFLEENAIQECINVLTNKQCDLVIFDYYNFNRKGKKKYIKAGTGLHNSKTAPWNKVYSRELWKFFSFPEGYWYEDLGIVPVVVANANNIVKINKALYSYETSRNTSQTNMINPLKLNDLIYMIENTYKELEKNGKLTNNKTEVESLFIDHLLHGLLFKLMYVDELEIRLTILNNIKVTLNKYFPEWKKSHKYNNKSIKNIIKKIVINNYLRGDFLLGDILWKFPKKVKEKIMG